MLAIIDCAIIRKSLHCYNGIVTRNNIPVTYHDAPYFNLEYLHDCQASGYIILGSKSNVEDKLPWQITLMNIMKKKIEQQIPVIGICFGHQLMAHAFGATIGKCAQDYQGYRKVNIINNHLGLKKGTSYNLIKAHSFEVKNLPANFGHLGTSSECTYDMIYHQKLPYVGIQCHPEATSDFILKALEINPPFSPPLKQAMSDGFSLIDQLIKNLINP